MRPALLATVTAACLCVLASTACGLNREGIVFATDATYRATVIGTNSDGFTVPGGILWRQGKLIIADTGGHALRLWSNAREVKTLCDATVGIASPEDVAVDDEGDIFFTDSETRGLWEVERTGKAFLLAGKDKGLTSPHGVAVAPSGAILVGDSAMHQVFSVSRAGEVSVLFGPDQGIRKPASLVFDETGRLFVADHENRLVYVLTPDMKVQRLIQHREGFSPDMLSYAHHVLYITDSTNGKLWRFTPEEGLKTIAVFAGTLNHPRAVTTDAEGNLYVSIQTDLRRKIGYIVKLEREHRPA